MESIYIGAIVSTIGMKNRKLGFYRTVTEKVSDSTTRQVFETLAQEEFVHLEAFCRLYQGDESGLNDILNRNEIFTDPYYCSLLASISGINAEYTALHIALRQEQSCIEWLTIFTDIIREPHIREVFATVLEETNRRSDMIRKECLRQTDQNPSSSEAVA